MNIKQLLVAVVALSSSAMFGAAVTVYNRTGAALSLQVGIYGQVFNAADAALSQVMSNGEYSKDGGLSDISYVQWIDRGVMYRVETGKLMPGLSGQHTMVIFPGGAYAIDYKAAGFGKKS